MDDRTCSDVSPPRMRHTELPASAAPYDFLKHLVRGSSAVTQVRHRSATHHVLHHGNGRNTCESTRPFSITGAVDATRECRLEPGEFSLKRVSGAEPPSANDKSSPGPTCPCDGPIVQDHRSPHPARPRRCTVPFTSYVMGGAAMRSRSSNSQAVLPSVAR